MPNAGVYVRIGVIIGIGFIMGDADFGSAWFPCRTPQPGAPDAKPGGSMACGIAIPAPG